jgi:LmbE family N-acetylglucosaminyl deacetylase
MSESLRLMVIGAHPDDAEYKAGGLAALYRGRGHEVLFVSVTDGSAGHHRASGPALAARRRTEAEAAGAVVGLRYDVWEHPDGRLEPSLPRREQVLRAIRQFRPDLVLTHRPNDYHPDHRVTSQLVQDSAYLLTVPAICPEVPALRRDPVIAYLSDDFTRPYPFAPSMIIDISAVWNQKVDMLDAHRSQFYEWLPYNGRYEADLPAGDGARRAWLAERMAALSRRLAQRLRAEILQAFGREVGSRIELIEAFEASEYGSPLDEEARRRLFPFGPDA